MNFTNTSQLYDALGADVYTVQCNVDTAECRAKRNAKKSSHIIIILELGHIWDGIAQITT